MSTHPLIACNEYPWRTFLQREGRDLQAELPTVLEQIAAIGFAGYEPLARDADHLAALVTQATRAGLSLPSVYVGSLLHDPALVDANIAAITAIAQVAAQHGTRILVTNPSPIAWDTPRDKSDAELATQAAALDRLGAALRDLGVTLAYHNHDMELRHAAREFHHMLCATDPAHVALCLDAHWIYRGAGNSQVALFDVVKLYGNRIVELHLRQSQNGAWTEAFGPGDIDYTRLLQTLAAQGVAPLLVLEQAVEPVSPHRLDGHAAHAHGLAYLQTVLAGLPSDARIGLSLRLGAPARVQYNNR